MIFASLHFVYLYLALFLLIYFLSSNIKWRNAVLLLFSLVFYSWGEPKLLILILICSFVCYLAGLFMHATQNTRKRRIYLTISTSVVLGMLAFFKYWAFLVGNINYVLKTQFPLWEIALPLGISFYTFQALTYVIDVYRHEVRVQKSFFKVSFIHFHVPSACGRTYCNVFACCRAD